MFETLAKSQNPVYLTDDFFNTFNKISAKTGRFGGRKSFAQEDPEELLQHYIFPELTASSELTDDRSLELETQSINVAHALNSILCPNIHQTSKIG
jgi:hypothetical protein